MEKNYDAIILRLSLELSDLEEQFKNTEEYKKGLYRKERDELARNTRCPDCGRSVKLDTLFCKHCHQAKKLEKALKNGKEYLARKIFERRKKGDTKWSIRKDYGLSEDGFYELVRLAHSLGLVLEEN